MKILIFSVLLVFAGIWMACWGWSMFPEWYGLAIQLSTIPMFFCGAIGAVMAFVEIERKKGE